MPESTEPITAEELVREVVGAFIAGNDDGWTLDALIRWRESPRRRRLCERTSERLVYQFEFEQSGRP